MIEADANKFREIMVGLGEVYNREITKTLTTIYWNALKQFDIEAVSVGATKHVQDPDVGQFMPKPGDIIRNIEGGTEDRALLAWTRVQKAIQRVGTYETVVFDDWKIHKVIQDIGGWVSLGKITEEKLPFTKNEFVKRYRAIKWVEDYPSKLTGMIEHDCEKQNRPDLIPPPKVIGDIEKAKSVYQLENKKENGVKKSISKALEQTTS